MHKLTYFPIGNADCCRVDLANGKKLLFDFADTRNPDDPDDRRCDLPRELRDDLDGAGRKNFDVVAFSHLDEDHFRGASAFFWFEHSASLQGPDRIKIDELWVPAGLLLEVLPRDEGHAEHRRVQDEAIHRFRRGERVRVFGRPSALRDWCGKKGIPFEQRQHLITDAGRVVEGFTLAVDGVEFFAHSPFGWRIDQDTVEDRNLNNLLLHGSFLAGQRVTKVLFTADSPHECLSDVVNITRSKGNEDRLEWHVGKPPHHCSYGSIGPEKGDDVTEPTDQVRWLWCDQQQGNGILICSSKPTPIKGTAEDVDPQPPHRQAANFYKQALNGDSSDDFRVTMEYPRVSRPRPLVIIIDGDGPAIDKGLPSIGIAIGSSQPPRAG